MKNVVERQRQSQLDQPLADLWVTGRLLEDYPLPSVQSALQSLPGAGELEQPLGRGSQLSIPHKAHGPHSLLPTVFLTFLYWARPAQQPSSPLLNNGRCLAFPAFPQLSGHLAGQIAPNWLAVLLPSTQGTLPTAHSHADLAAEGALLS